MSEDQKKRKSPIKEQRPGTTSGAPPMSSKTTRKESGKVVRQYPAELGYHGSGDETKLNPEE